MPAEPAPLSPAFPLALAPAGLGRAERVALALLAAVAVMLLAAWQIPPMLDWSRYRSTIATYASTRLGRPVDIAGKVRLTLLPTPMLMADRVTLADQGDGLSARLGTMRLEVALGSLLAGHVVPRALSLDDPSAILPWPPPRGTSQHLPARVAREFFANVTGGTLVIGGIALQDITASLRTDPESGAFAAQGNARVAGLPWRFTAVLGAPDAEGISPLSLTLDGLPARRPARTAPARTTPDMQGTGGTFHGRLLPDGSMAGMLVLRGPDLSRLSAGPALAWQVQGPIAADGLTVRAPGLDLRLAGSPGRAKITLRLAPPARLSVQAAVARLPAGGWMRRLLQGAASSPLAAELDLSAGAIDVQGATLRAPHLRLTNGPEGARIGAASVILPGGTQLETSGLFSPAGAFTGQLHMIAPSLHATLAWLQGAVVHGLPPFVLSTADLRGNFSANSSRLAWSALSGRIDGSATTGGIAFDRGARPALDVDLQTPRLPLAGWALPLPVPVHLPELLDDADARIRLSADEIDWPRVPMRHAMIEATSTRAGLSLKRLALDVPGGHLEASGGWAKDGRLSDGRLDLTAADAAILPASWRIPAALWQGGFHLAVTGGGPPSDMAIALRADLGDLRAEAEAHLDMRLPAIEATATLRHPGAPRLLAAFGLPDARDWLDDGSFAMVTHLAMSPNGVRARDFSISAGALQMGGALDMSRTPQGLALTGHVDAASLPLPGWPAMLAVSPDLSWLHGVAGSIDIKADRVLAGLTPAARNGSATLLTSGGVTVLEVGKAALPHGQIAGALVVDSNQDAPAFSVRGLVTGLAPEAILPQPPSPPGLALRGGTMDLSLDLFGHAAGSESWLASSAGDIRMQLRASTLVGLNLDAAGSGRRHVRPLPTSGFTAPLSGGIDAAVDGGTAVLSGGLLSGPSGAITISGTLDAIARTMTLHLLARPAVSGSVDVPVDLGGGWFDARTTQRKILLFLKKKKQKDF